MRRLDLAALVLIQSSVSNVCVKYFGVTEVREEEGVSVENVNEFPEFPAVGGRGGQGGGG